MEDYQIRLKNEHDELRSKYVELTAFIYGQEQKLSNVGIGNSSLMLLKQQRTFMKRYLDVLEKRCILEGIKL